MASPFKFEKKGKSGIEVSEVFPKLGEHVDKMTVLRSLWTDIPDPHTPMGARGIGEIGITGTAAAVANAVFNATGVRVRNLPITLDKLL